MLCTAVTSRVGIDTPVNVRGPPAAGGKGALRRQTRRDLPPCAAGSCTQRGAIQPSSMPRLGREGRGNGPVFLPRAEQAGRDRATSRHCSGKRCAQRRALW